MKFIISAGAGSYERRVNVNNNNGNNLDNVEKRGRGRCAKIEKRNSPPVADEPNPSWFKPVEHVLQAVHGETGEERSVKQIQNVEDGATNGIVDGAIFEFLGRKFQECTKFLCEELSKDINKFTMHLSGGRDEDLKGFRMQLD